MGVYIQILALVICGIVLLWFGYSLFFGKFSPFSFKKNRQENENRTGEPGDPQVCPICSVKLVKGELVKSLAFPSVSGGKDRLMYIRGCYRCLNNNLPRRCPVCGIDLDVNDYLISRMFERPRRKNHVHVLGCNHCRNTGSLAR